MSLYVYTYCMNVYYLKKTKKALYPLKIENNKVDKFILIKYYKKNPNIINIDKKYMLINKNTQYDNNKCI